MYDIFFLFCQAYKDDFYVCLSVLYAVYLFRVSDSGE